MNCRRRGLPWRASGEPSVDSSMRRVGRGSEYLLQAPAIHRRSVILNLPLIEDCISTFEIEVQVLPGVGEKDQLLATLISDVTFPKLNEPRTDTCSLKGGIDGQGAGVPDSFAGLLIVVAGFSCSGIHGQPVIEPFPVSGLVNLQPSVKQIAEVRRLTVGGWIELRDGCQLSFLLSDKVCSHTVIGLVFPPDDSKLDPVPFLLLGKLIGEIFIVIKCTSRELRSLADLAVFHLSKFQCHIMNGELSESCNSQIEQFS